MILFLVSLTVLSAWWISSVPLIDPDEGRYTAIPLAMLDTGDFVAPRQNGVLYLEKPPLHYWLTALSVNVFGRNEFALRLPSTLFTLSGCLLVFWLGSYMIGRRAARWSAAFLATAPLFASLGSFNVTDTTLTFFLTLTLALFWMAQRNGKGRNLFWYGMFVAAALTVLAKGLIGIVLPGGIIGLFILIERRWELLKPIPLLLGTMLFLAVAAPWHIAASLEIPGFAWFYFVKEHFLRFSTGVHDRSQPFWYFLPVLAVLFLPWSGLLPLGVSDLRVRRSAGYRSNQPELLFLSLWFGVILVFFSLSNSKLISYVLPCFIPMALIAGRGAVHWLEKSPSSRALSRWLVLAQSAVTLLALLLAILSLGVVHSREQFPDSRILSALAAATFVVGTVAIAARGAHVRRRPQLFLHLGSAILFTSTLLSAAPRVGDMRSTSSLATCLHERLVDQESVDVFRAFPTSLMYYSQRRMVMVDGLNELEYGAGLLSPEERARWFPDAEAYAAAWHAGAPKQVLLERKKLHEAAAFGITGTPVCENYRYVLLDNRDPPHDL